MQRTPRLRPDMREFGHETSVGAGGPPEITGSFCWRLYCKPPVEDEVPGVPKTAGGSVCVCAVEENDLFGVP